MATISAVIITYNEAENIGLCIESMKNIVDEIIIIDSYSTDKTLEITQTYNCQFFQCKWDNYSSAKNFGNSKATKDYILSIDADEQLSAELQKSILQFKKTQTENAAYCFNRRNYYCGKIIRHGGWYPDTKTRLWPNSMGIWRGLVHEQVHFNRQLPVVHLKGDLLHFTYHSIAHHKQKVKRYAEFAAQNNTKSSFIKAVLSSSFRFLKTYIIKLGFLDGYYGFTIARLSALEAFLKYSTK